MEERHWIILGSGSLQTFYVGKTKHSLSVEKLMESNRPIELTEARILIHNAGMAMGPNGPGISIGNRVWPFPMTQGSATVSILATVCINPVDNPGMLQAIEEMVRNCEELETQMRAQSAGLIPARTLSGS